MYEKGINCYTQLVTYGASKTSDYRKTIDIYSKFAASLYINS